MEFCVPDLDPMGAEQVRRELSVIHECMRAQAVRELPGRRHLRVPGVAGAGIGVPMANLES